MLSRLIKTCFSGCLVFLTIGLFFVSNHVLAFNGPHKIGPNECDVCHIPHHAADDMLWARATTGPFLGIKRLCASCHGKGLFGAKHYDIFEYERGDTYDHVMGQEASINGPSIIREDWAPFPLKEKEGGNGFYCGSCHDPHLDPYEPVGDEGGGDYLRQETAELIKDAKDKEMPFCTQCHKGITFGDAFGHGNKKGCYDCHHPHASKNPGSKILISPLVSFTAIPNCRDFSDSAETVSACYGCHKEGSGFDGSLGAPLAGDDLSASKEHHPMGVGADTSTSGHQPTQTGPLSPSGELYCGTCHTVHDGTNDHYLNPQVVLTYDPGNSALFCIACHSNKTIEDLGPRGEGHHQISPNNQCLFCHSVHNAPNDPDALFQTDEDEADLFNSSVSVDVIMRIAPENLAWSDKILDMDTRDYEDACYGCHSEQDIVGKEFSLNEENSLLLDNVRDKFFSHRFYAVPSASIKLINTFDDRLPIVSDGLETETINDYGVEEGRIWCGSCHNVHRQNRFSAEVHEDYKERRSAYLRAENYGSDLCHRCHSSYYEDMGTRNHPQDNPLEEGVPLLYYEGYSAGIGGITNGETRFDTAQGEVVCQTCHSVHTAKTAWDGGSNKDDLLGHGRLLVKALDDDKGLCYDCHSFTLGLEETETIDGPHGDERIRSPKGDCATCHIPHNAKGLKIWARISKNPGLYNGIHMLCQTCHDGTMFSEGNPIGDVGDIIEGYESGDYPPINESDYFPVNKYKGQFIVKTRVDGENDIYASTGTDDVLDEREDYSSWEGPFENHVMHGGADISLDSALIYFNPEIFPLDPADKDTFPEPPADEKYRSGGAGVYCGTCHNPHKQPDDNLTGGFYLRTRPNHDVGNPWDNRKPFCSQCHGEIHAPESDCLACHHPHLGNALIEDNEIFGRKIFLYPVEEKTFEATPNVLRINDSRDEDWPQAALCYGCHNDAEANLWGKAGAVPIFGDDMDNQKREHHPMGNQAWLGDSSKVSNGIFIRAPGTPLDVLNNNQEITCISCHDGFHGPGSLGAKGKNKKNNFLRWKFTKTDGPEEPKSTDPTYDSTEFCVKCHSDKKDLLKGKHLQTRAGAFDRKLTRSIYAYDPNIRIVVETEVGCANCMFCHFIHDGDERQQCSPAESITTLVIMPDLDALMRIAPENLAWGDRLYDTDNEDYEDMCYGCHSNEDIVGEGCNNAALLKWSNDNHTHDNHTHRFASAPDPNNPPSKVIKYGGVFPLSDGKGIDTKNDYGTKQDTIFCGTCHNVHDGTVIPYLNYEPLDKNLSPYKPYSFCEECHDAESNQLKFVHNSHPIDKGPYYPTTVVEWPELYYKGESGCQGGVILDGSKSGEIICLTCHNVHAAATNWKGGISTDPNSSAHGKLLVKDNLSTKEGSNLCKDCHAFGN